MRRPFLGLAAALAIVVLSPSSEVMAQVGGIGVGADPFSFYYGYYLPHAAAMAMQPTPLDTINQMTQQRQYAAQTDRAQLYDPISPYGDEEADPLRPYANRKGERIARPQGFGIGDKSNARGNGPATYYGRTARYFPDLKVGRGPNRNLAVHRSGRGGGMGGGMGGMGMGGMGMGMPGPR
jgi:hypothetical protein